MFYLANTGGVDSILLSFALAQCSTFAFKLFYPRVAMTAGCVVEESDDTNNKKKVKA